MFYKCALTTFEVPASVTEIARRAFNGCDKLTSVTFEEGCQLQIIGVSAFQGTGLVEFVMPDTVEYLGDSIFQNCQSLKRVTLSKNLVTISSTDVGPFYQCDVFCS